MVLDKETTITIGKLGTFQFQKGRYAYVGSAMNGIEQRVARHKRKEKRLHWHIDYLLEHAEIKSVETIMSSTKENECRLARRFLKTHQIPVPGFGSSDCSCKSHLFKIKTSKNLKKG